MEWQATPYTFPAAAAGVLVAALGLFVRRRRMAPGAGEFALFTLAVSLWCLANAGEFASATLAGKLLWSKVEYVGIACAPPLWLACMAAYTGSGSRSPPRRLALLAAVPIVTITLVWTNEWHHLVWTSSGLVASGSFMMWTATYGAWFWVHSAYCYLVLALAARLIVRWLRRSPRPFQGQAISLLLGMATPWLANVVYITRLSPFPYLDLTSFGFALGSGAVGLSLFRFRLFEVIPIAREVLLEQLPDAVVVLDARDRVVDVNPAARGLMGLDASAAIGHTADEVLVGWPRSMITSTELSSRPAELVLRAGTTDRHFDVRVAALTDGHQRDVGRLVVLRDITERKQAEREHEQLLRDQAARVTDERSRIAHELHDRVAQTFFSIGLTARAALDGPVAPAGDGLREALSSVLRSAEQGADQLRDAIFALTRAEVHDHGLVRALWQLVREFQQATGIEADLVVTGAERHAPSEVAEALHAVAREGLANAQQHAQASAVVVSLSFESESATLTVQDDGIGAPSLVLSNLPESATRFGLRGMRERVVRQGGTFTAEPGDEGGFVVRVRVPLPDLGAPQRP